MPTVATHPDAGYPGLPPGGSPAADDAYLEWARRYCEQLALCAALLDNGPPPSVWRLTDHLFRWLDGERHYPAGAKHNHRLRFVAIRFALQPEAIRREADRYAETEGSR